MKISTTALVFGLPEITKKHCPVCGFLLKFEPYEDGLCSFEICYCCGSQFGYDDSCNTEVALKERWGKLRDA